MTLYVYQSDDSLWVLLGIENMVPACVYDYEIKNDNYFFSTLQIW